MIDSNDLMLGNLVMVLHEESISIKRVDAEFIKLSLQYQNDPDDDCFARGFNYDAIKLTPEILKAIDFIQNKGTITTWSNDRDFHIVSNANGLLFCCDLFDDSVFYIGSTSIKSLHHLQNIFRLLKGIDLKINIHKLCKILNS